MRTTMISDIKRSQRRRLLMATVLRALGLVMVGFSLIYNVVVVDPFSLKYLTLTSVAVQLGLMFGGSGTFLFAGQWRDAIKDEIRRWNT